VQHCNITQQAQEHNVSNRNNSIKGKGKTKALTQYYY